MNHYKSEGLSRARLTTFEKLSPISSLNIKLVRHWSEHSHIHIVLQSQYPLQMLFTSQGELNEFIFCFRKKVQASSHGISIKMSPTGAILKKLDTWGKWPYYITHAWELGSTHFRPLSNQDSFCTGDCKLPPPEHPSLLWKT